MKLSNQQCRICAWLCVVQVCLLSIASVSPQIHSWVFHGEQFVGDVCSHADSNCDGLPQAPEEGSSQSDFPDDKNQICPVVLFAQGVIFEDGSGIQLLEGRVVVASIETEPEAVWESALNGEVQARAPPLS